MDIRFGDGEEGYHEARALLGLLGLAEAADPAASAEIKLLDDLREAATRHCARPEFAALEATAPAPRDLARETWWRALLGPSRREVLLSAQRSEALERASRAERSAFEALAETARVARERDELKARLRALAAVGDGAS